MEGVGFFTAIAILTAYQPELILGAVATQTLMEPFTKDWEQGNVDEMWQKYYRESFKLGHRVLLVSHSQGNLFANRIFDTINPTEYKKYFANVQVASPASQVKADEVGKGAYVTLFGDPIINPIPGSMPGNANGSPGHAFVTAYLDQQDPFDKIVSRIKAALPTLDVELTQWDTEGEPSNKGTCEEKVKVKHRFDLAVDMPFDVYPFNLSKKLYQVNGEWVKASCGGNNILDQWDGKKDNECWMIDNVEREKITLAGSKYSISLTARATAGENMCAELIGGVWIGSKTVHSHCNMQTGSCSYNIEELCDKSVAYTSETFGQMLNILNQDVESLKNKLATIDPMITLGKFEVKPISSYESYSTCYRGKSSGTGKGIVYQIDIQIMSAYMNVETLYGKLGSIASDYGLYFWRKI